MKIIYLGNFEPPHSTENHVARALRHNGHEVVQWQEGGAARPLFGGDADFILWTRTKSLSATNEDMLRFMRTAMRVGIPVVGYHLDIWWGLKREHEIFEDAFFEVDLLVTADGGHDADWEAAGVNHVWFPPGVSLAETEPGMFRSDLASPLAFVGNHNGDYHAESEHRHALVRWLRQNFTRDCAFWPRPGEHAIRGNDLRDLYASVDVVVGDSCFTGTGLKNYWSDRIPETVGRGGFLLHPYVDGLVEQGFTSDTMATWTAFDWEALGIQIEWALTHPEERKHIARTGREVVRAEHTYERRMEQLVRLLVERNMLRNWESCVAPECPPIPDPPEVVEGTMTIVEPAPPKPVKKPAKKATKKAAAK